MSVVDEFDTNLPNSSEGSDGSAVLVVRIGSLSNNAPNPRGTQFQPAPTPPSVPVGDTDLSEFVGNESTIFGSYTVGDIEDEEDPVPHMVTPAAGTIDPAIQAAVLAASSDIAGIASEGGLATTGEIVDLVRYYAGDAFTRSQIAEVLFGATEPLGATGPEDDFSCEAEGELFPHEPDDEGPLFVFGFSFDETGALTTDVCQPAEVEVKESSVNLKKKGTVSVAIYDSDDLETDDIVEVQIHGVSAGKIQHSKNKATAQFSVPDLIDGFALTSSTTHVFVVATLSDGSCFAGFADINVK